MSTKAMRNFHIPLSEDLYNKLKAEAKRSKQPATKLARQAIDLWLWQRQKAALHKAIAAYAAQCAGTESDLDETLETASIEHLLALDLS
jgi:predicted transcriptional regulator